MSMQLVNGVLCLNCSDVERAKKVGLSGSTNTPDPLHPSTEISNRGDTSSAGGTSSANGPSGASATAPGSDASGVGPSSTDPSSAVAQSAAPAFGVNQPLAGGDRGTQLNLLT